MKKVDKKNVEEVRRIQLYLASVVKKICSENQINYFLVGGSYLGAEQNEGFIYGDKDIDIGMERECYNKFLDIINKKLPSNIGFVNEKNDKDFSFLYTKLYFKGSNLAIDNDSDYGIFIDICPYDKTFNLVVLREIKYILFKIFKWLLILKNKNKKEIKGIGKRNLKFISEFISREKIIAFSYRILFTGKYGKAVQNFTCGNKTDWFLIDEIKNVKEKKFCNDSFLVPNSYRYLKLNYGDWTTNPIVKEDIFKYYFNIKE